MEFAREFARAVAAFARIARLIPRIQIGTAQRAFYRILGMTRGGAHGYSLYGVEKGYSPVVRWGFGVAFSALLAAAPLAAGAQDLGLWQARIGEGISYGEPGKPSDLVARDPVAALPIAPRPPAQAAAAARLAAPAPHPVAHTAVAAAPAVQNRALEPAPVRNLMAPNYDPDVPLPHPDLQGYVRPEPRMTGPHPYVRATDQGGVFGFSVPTGGRNTRYSGGFNGPTSLTGGQ